MYFKIWTKLLLCSSTELLNRWEMSAVVPTCHEALDRKLRDSWTQPCSQLTRCSSQETPGFLRDFSISQPCTAHTHPTGAPCAAPLSGIVFLMGCAHKIGSMRQLKCLAKLSPWQSAQVPAAHPSHSGSSQGNLEPHLHILGNTEPKVIPQRQRSPAEKSGALQWDQGH